jgi:hypothetical protein
VIPDRCRWEVSGCLHMQCSSRRQGLSGMLLCGGEPDSAAQHHHVRQCMPPRQQTCSYCIDCVVHL